MPPHQVLADQVRDRVGVVAQGAQARFDASHETGLVPIAAVEDHRAVPVIEGVDLMAQLAMLLDVGSEGVELGALHQRELIGGWMEWHPGRGRFVLRRRKAHRRSQLARR